ncbi:hypothetical protein DSECCO2_493830 [anaerobic digester metagenome]
MGILSGSDIERINDNIDSKLKEKINSTIGTEKEKPLDFFSKTILANDGHFYSPKMDYGLKAQTGSQGVFQQSYGGAFIALSSARGLIYCLSPYETSSTNFCPCTLSVDNLSQSSGNSVNKNYYVTGSSTSKLIGITYDEVTDSVFYTAGFSQDGGTIISISKFTGDLGTRVAKVQVQANNSLVVAGEGYVYDINGGSPTIKKYNANNLALIGTYAINGLIAIFSASYSDGYLYCCARFIGKTSFSLIKIDVDTFNIQQAIGGESTEENPSFSYTQCMDSDYLYIYATVSSKRYIYKIRKTDFTVIAKVDLGTEILSATSFSNIPYAACYKGFAIFTCSPRTEMLILDTSTMLFSVQATSTDGGLAVHDNNPSYDNALYYFVGIKRVQKYIDIAFTVSGEYERVE